MNWLRRFSVCLAVVFLSANCYAQTSGPATIIEQDFDRQKQLDGIFIQLAKETDQTNAKEYAAQLKHIWMMTPDGETAEDMNRAIRSMREFNLPKALALLNSAIERHPDFAESWNQRAYVHFLGNDYEKSLSDCEQALKLEPRHIGCMSGMARIFIRKQHRFAEGRAVLGKALKLYPLIYERILLNEIPK